MYTLIAEVIKDINENRLATKDIRDTVIRTRRNIINITPQLIFKDLHRSREKINAILEGGRVNHNATDWTPYAEINLGFIRIKT